MLSDLSVGRLRKASEARRSAEISPTVTLDAMTVATHAHRYKRVSTITAKRLNCYMKLTFRLWCCNNPPLQLALTLRVVRSSEFRFAFSVFTNSLGG